MGEQSPRQGPLPMEEFYLFSGLNTFAGGTVDALRECWDGTAYNVAGSERSGLWYAYALSKYVDAALTLPTFMALRDLWPGATMDERYVFQSAILTIRHSIPFSPDERAALASEHNEDDYGFESMTITRHQPALVKRWHDWIWSDERGLSVAPDAPRTGPSVMLAESCARLYRLTGDGHWDIVGLPRPG